MYGSTAAGAARGLALRMDHGSQYLSDHFTNQIKFWGIQPSYAFVAEPQTNGVAERFNRTLKEQIIHGRIYPVRYADDFLIFVAGGYDDAAAEKQALADWLREEMGLTLSEEKTRITRLTEGFRFLGCRVRLKWDDRYGYRCRIEIPKEVVNDLRWRIKKMLTQRTHLRSLESMLREINPILRGWGHYYRYCIGAKRILYLLDWYVWRRLWLWMRGKQIVSRRVV